MITLIPTTSADNRSCPKCGTAPKFFLYRTSENLQLRKVLNRDKQDATSFHARSCTGSCHACGCNYHGFELIIIDADIDPYGEFADIHFRDELRGHVPSRHFIASRGETSWRVQIAETSEGELFRHLFGPLLINMPVLSFGQEMLLHLWAEIRELSRRKVI